MLEYGTPATFPSYDEALQYGIRLYKDAFQTFNVKVVKAKKAQELTERFVEFMSGRLGYPPDNPTTLSTVNPQRPTYARIMEIMARIRQGGDFKLAELSEEGAHNFYPAASQAIRPPE